MFPFRCERTRTDGILCSSRLQITPFNWDNVPKLNEALLPGLNSKKGT